MTVFVCGEEPGDIWCAIYDAWMSRLGHANVRIEPEGADQGLFCEYREVAADDEKVEKVTRSIRGKLGEQVYEEAYKAALSQDRFRADKIYRFLIAAFALGPGVLDCLQFPEVYEIFRMNRHLMREYDHLRGFVRFAEWRHRILASRIAPKNDVTELLARHFADRMPEENWLIYDVNRTKGALHRGGQGWMVVHVSWGELAAGRLAGGGTDRETLKEEEEFWQDGQVYEKLWKVFHESIAIQARYNPKCQRNMLPLRFRPYMTEFT